MPTLPWFRKAQATGAAEDTAPTVSVTADEKLSSGLQEVNSLSEGEDTAPNPHLARLRPDGTYRVTFYRSVFWNITVLGLCSFLAPGLWGGLSLLGAGGGEDVSTVNASNSLTCVLPCPPSGQLP